PLVLGKLRDRCNVLEARIRDDGVEPAEALEGGADNRAVALARRQVGVGHVDAVHRPPVGFEPGDDRYADPAGRAGDERDATHPPSRKLDSATQTCSAPPS